MVWDKILNEEFDNMKLNTSNEEKKTILVVLMKKKLKIIRIIF